MNESERAPASIKSVNQHNKKLFSDCFTVTFSTTLQPNIERLLICRDTFGRKKVAPTLTSSTCAADDQPLQVDFESVHELLNILYFIVEDSSQHRANAVVIKQLQHLFFQHVIKYAISGDYICD